MQKSLRIKYKSNSETYESFKYCHCFSCNFQAHGNFANWLSDDLQVMAIHCRSFISATICAKLNTELEWHINIDQNGVQHVFIILHYSKAHSLQRVK